MTWQNRAACRSSPALFDADLDTPETPEQRDERHDAARAICTRCPVMWQCLSDAISDTAAEGIRHGHLYERPDE